MYRLNPQIKVAHLARNPDRLVTVEPLASMVGHFLHRLEILLPRPLRPRRPGRKRKDAEKQIWRRRKPESTGPIAEMASKYFPMRRDSAFGSPSWLDTYVNGAGLMEGPR